MVLALTRTAAGTVLLFFCAGRAASAARQLMTRTVMRMDQTHWLDDATPRSGGCGSCSLVVLALRSAESGRRPCIRYFGARRHFGFDAWFGFASCVALIVVAKALGAGAQAPGHLLRRADDWSSPPGLVLIVGGLLLPLLRGALRAAADRSCCRCSRSSSSGRCPTARRLQRALPRLRAHRSLQGDELSRLFATVFALMAFGGGLFALNQKRARRAAGGLLSMPARAIGVAFAGDLLTVFVFWELMAVGSTLVIWSAGSRAVPAPALRYADDPPPRRRAADGRHRRRRSRRPARVAFGTHGARLRRARWLILAGFLVNAGAPPLSAWLPDAYPEASWSGTVFLSAFTTKTAVYVLMRGFPGTELLIWVGLFMVFYGIVYALLENDMRRILAYSIVNQVGFMVAGIGIGTEMALNGAAAHAFTHIIYKALLLMSAGSVLYMTGKRKCTDLGGLFHTHAADDDLRHHRRARRSRRSR